MHAIVLNYAPNKTFHAEVPSDSINSTLLRLITEVEKLKTNQEIMIKMVQLILRVQKQHSDGPLLPDGVKFPIATMGYFDGMEEKLEDATFFNAMVLKESILYTI